MFHIHSFKALDRALKESFKRHHTKHTPIWRESNNIITKRYATNTTCKPKRHSNKI